MKRSKDKDGIVRSNFGDSRIAMDRMLNKIMKYLKVTLFNGIPEVDTEEQQITQSKYDSYICDNLKSFVASLGRSLGTKPIEVQRAYSALSRAVFFENGNGNKLSYSFVHRRLGLSVASLSKLDLQNTRDRASKSPKLDTTVGEKLAHHQSSQQLPHG